MHGKIFCLLFTIVVLQSLCPVESAGVRHKRSPYQGFMDSFQEFGNYVKSAAESAGSSVMSFFNKAGQWFQGKGR